MNMNPTLSQFTRTWMAKDEEIRSAYERVTELESGLRGMIGLVQLLSHNRDIPQSTRDEMMNNHRVIDAQEMLS